MKPIKHILLTVLTVASALGMSSCDDLLDLEPKSQITPEAYYTTADQMATYLNNYYDSWLYAPYVGRMYHVWGSWNDGMIASDANTDIFCSGLNGNTTLFSDDHWEVPSSKQLQGYYTVIRQVNFFINNMKAKMQAGQISGDETMVNNYLGEGYFFRAVNYFRLMALYGDVPIVRDVLEDNNDEIVGASQRSPRNEVARFIIQDLDSATALLCPRSQFNGQRVNRESAYLFKSRVALFEGTFEKYHKGSGRVPGDANWPGAKMSYNSGKTFNIDSEVKYFLQQAMQAAKVVGDQANLTENNHVIEPQVGTITGWNPYFEMFSQPSLQSVDEVLLWKQYDKDLNVCHDVPYRSKVGSGDGFTRAFAQSFLMKNGLPIYAQGSGYHGDTSIDNVKADRDERLQLFVWGESTIMDTDPSAPTHNVYSPEGSLIDHIDNDNQEIRCITGYQCRKYYTYDYVQTPDDAIHGTNACPIFRTSEALLNYMEAEYELNGSLDGTARQYWQQLRARAGVSTDIDATIAATDLSQELDFGVYSGTAAVDKTLYNIRRERMNELFSEGLRFADLIRWRSFDRMITTKWVPEGVNFWDEMYKTYRTTLKADGSADAAISQKSLSKYVRPYSRSMAATNELRDGYKWHEAYYLYPLGISDLQTASADRDALNSNLYQNIYWPTNAGSMAEK